ncbi:MAG: hypothetical protein HYV63_11075 [Candidatus Schekmanbacteria bacterium]|nr:hypothetical protein [Candidatus Schekmanbacteria bacterium]
MRRTIVWGGDPKIEDLLKDIRPQLLHVLLTTPADRRRVEESLGGGRLRHGIRSVFYHEVSGSNDAVRVAKTIERKVTFQPGSSLEIELQGAPEWLNVAFSTAEATPATLEPVAV